MKTTVRESPATLAILAVLVLAGLGLRIGYAVEQPASPPPDAEAYARIAENLYLDGSFDARPEGAAREVQPSSAYSPGLPLLVAGVYWVSGGAHLTLALVLLAILRRRRDPADLPARPSLRRARGRADRRRRRSPSTRPCSSTRGCC